MSGVPYTFATATTSIPLSQLDANFATVATLGNASVGLGNTTSVVGNLTLQNVTITSGTSNITTNVASVTGILPQANGGTGTTTGYYGFKNRIINGAMMIDQRNAGASVTPNLLAYTVDRTFGFGSVTGKFSCQQNSGSVTPPAGFINYIGAVSLSAYSVGSGEQYIFGQVIEGLNVADLNWGTANAQSVTLSFWVRSSLTGTFGGSLQNNGFDRSYPFSYVINSANTWEYKTITIAGDTTGTWLKTNGAGIRLGFSLGAGSTLSGSAGSWAGANYVSATGATSVVGTNGATFYITGVQLEVGTAATSFDYRPYGTELQLCQRYFQQYQHGLGGVASNSTTAILCTIFPTVMRSAPSVAVSGTITCTDTFAVSSAQSSASASISGSATSDGSTISLPNFSGFTQGRVIQLDPANPNKVQFSAEL